MIALKSNRNTAAPSGRKSTTPPDRTSKKQSAANRRNAKKSTGPKTKRGKAATRKNAIKHGLFAKNLPTHELPFLQDRAAYEEQLAQLTEDFEPKTQIEMNIIANLAMDYMRLSYIHAMESAVLERHLPPQQEVDKIQRNLKREQSKFTEEDLRQQLTKMQEVYLAINLGNPPSLPVDTAKELANGITLNIEYYEDQLTRDAAAYEELKKQEPKEGADKAQWEETMNVAVKHLDPLLDYVILNGREAMGYESTEQVIAQLRGKTEIHDEHRPAWQRTVQNEMTQIQGRIDRITAWQRKLDNHKTQYMDRLLDETAELDKLKPSEAAVQRNIDRHLKRLKLVRHDLLA